MRLLAAIPLFALLPACRSGLDEINLGRRADGTPRASIKLSPEARQEARAAAQRTAAGGSVPQPIAPPPAVLEGPVIVGLRHDGRCVVAGKEVGEEEVGARLSYVREERRKAGSSDVATVTVHTENQVPMERVMHAMSCGHQAGFTKIGWQLVEAVPLPAPEPIAAALPADEGRLILSLAADGTLHLGQEALKADALAARLKEAVEARRAQSLPPPNLTILADQDAPMASVKEALDACGAAGIDKVAFGSPVVVSAPAVTVGATPFEVSELYRNWRLGLESRDIDFTEGSPAYWYDALFHGFDEEHGMLVQELRSTSIIRKRVSFFGGKCADHLGQMSRLLSAVDAERGAALKSLSDVYRASALSASEGRSELNAARMHLASLRGRVVKEFPPSSTAFPRDLKIPPPETPEPEKEKGKTP